MSTDRTPLIERLHGSAEPRITVVRSGALGDTILTLPALQLLHEYYPGARITLVGSAWAQRLQPLVPWPLEVVRFDSPRLTPVFGPEPEDRSGLFHRADAALVYGADGADGLARNVRALCPGPVVQWPVEPRGNEHAALHFARAAAPTDRHALPAPRLRAAGGNAPAQAPRHALAVHPGSGGRRKCWPARHFAQVAADLGRPVVLVEGPADGEPCGRFRRALGDAVPVQAARGLSVDDLAKVLCGCSALLGNDSGISHLAAALGMRTLAVFGPTDPQVWRPLGPAASACGGRGEWPEPAAVLQALEGP
jgi:ADP-heptose:LPS heptosyltransferase